MSPVRIAYAVAWQHYNQSLSAALLSISAKYFVKPPRLGYIHARIYEDYEPFTPSSGSLSLDPRKP